MKPLVGMGVTYQVGSDRYAGTIVSVSKTGKTFRFRDDRPGGRRGEELLRAFLDSEGNWRWKSSTRARYSWFVIVGARNPYLDPSF